MFSLDKIIRQKTLYNLVGFQTNLKMVGAKRIVAIDTRLEGVNVVRYGVMHRNTFINSPKVLNASLQSRKRPDLFFAGQITGRKVTQNQSRQACWRG